MEIKKAYLDMIKRFNGGWDAMCGALGMTRSSLENRIYERKGQCVSVDLALQLQAFSQSSLFAEAIATASGGTFIKLPEFEELDNEELERKFKDVCAYLGKLAHLHNEATADGEVDARERIAMESVAAEIHRTIGELLALTFRLYCRHSKLEGVTSIDQAFRG